MSDARSRRAGAGHSPGVRVPASLDWRTTSWRPGLLAAARRLLPPVALAVAVLATWEGAVRVSGISSLILPRPSEVGSVMISQAPSYLRNSLTTGTEAMLGLFLAAVCGGLGGVAIAASPILAGALYPLLISAQVMPKVAIAPLLIIWLGFDSAPKVILTALIAFFPIVINTVVGLNLTRREAIYLFRSMGARPWQTYLKLRVPNALPVFFGGLKVAATLSVIGAVVGEFAGASAGLGHLLLIQVGRLEMAAAFGSVLYLTLMGLAVFAVVATLERLLEPPHMRRQFDGSVQGWRGSGRERSSFEGAAP